MELLCSCISPHLNCLRILENSPKNLDLLAKVCWSGALGVVFKIFSFKGTRKEMGSYFWAITWMVHNLLFFCLCAQKLCLSAGFHAWNSFSSCSSPPNENFGVFNPSSFCRLFLFCPHWSQCSDFMLCALFSCLSFHFRCRLLLMNVRTKKSLGFTGGGNHWFNLYLKTNKCYLWNNFTDTDEYSGFWA